jgi:hypothetical protein
LPYQSGVFSPGTKNVAPPLGWRCQQHHDVPDANRNLLWLVYALAATIMSSSLPIRLNVIIISGLILYYRFRKEKAAVLSTVH